MVDTPTPFEALERVVEALGSQAELSRICDVTPTAVWKWMQSSKRLPAEFVLRVEAATGISRHWLRPDIYPVEHGATPVWQGVDRRLQPVSVNRRRTLKQAMA